MVLTINTTRFGTVATQSGDILYFPLGLPGWEHLDRWVLLADRAGGDVVWLQSVDRGEIALAAVDPRRFVPQYLLHARRWELGPVGNSAAGDLRTLVIVSHDGEGLTINLKAPLVVDLRRRLGCQTINCGDWPLGHSIDERRTMALRRRA